VLDDEDIIRYSSLGRILQLSINNYGVYAVNQLLLEFEGSGVLLYDDGFPPNYDNSTNIYFAVFRTAEDALLFKLKYNKYVI